MLQFSESSVYEPRIKEWTAGQHTDLVLTWHVHDGMVKPPHCHDKLLPSWTVWTVWSVFSGQHECDLGSSANQGDERVTSAGFSSLTLESWTDMTPFSSIWMILFWEDGSPFYYPQNMYIDGTATMLFDASVSITVIQTPSRHTQLHNIYTDIIYTVTYTKTRMYMDICI